MASRGKPYVPTDADRIFVERAVMAGTVINNIADCLNITDDTLRKHFRYEIMTARERMKGDAIRVLMDSLTDGSLDAAKYVLSRVAGWTERNVVDNTSSDGSMTPKPGIDLSKAPIELLEWIVAKNDDAEQE